MGSVSRARFPSAPVCLARAAAPPVEEANQRLGGDESRARRGTGTGVARRASCACVSPRGSRTGHVARHGCRVGLRKAARGGRARGSVSPRRGRQGVFSWKRRKRAGSWDSRRVGLLSGSRLVQASAASLFTKVRLFASELFLTSRARHPDQKGKPPTGAFAPENRRGASAGTDLSPPPCRRPIETTHRPKLHTPPVTMSDYGSDVEDDSEHTLANVGFPRSVCFQACFVSHVGCGFQARSREARASFARPVPALNRSID